MSPKKGKIFVISGPSGSGKTTLRDRLLKEKKIKKLFVKSVSFTTRKIRTGEQEGRDYFYISEKSFRQKLRGRKILEWTRYLGYYYATSRDFVSGQLKKGKSILLCLDLKGALKVKKLFPENSVTVFIKPPSIKELKRRIEQRCSKTCGKEIGKRLELAGKEALSAAKYDYRIVNKNLPQACQKLRGIALKEIMINKGER
jgi:guanylate kinase